MSTLRINRVIAYQTLQCNPQSPLPPNRDFFTWVCVRHPNDDRVINGQFTSAEQIFYLGFAIPQIVFKEPINCYLHSLFIHLYFYVIKSKRKKH